LRPANAKRHKLHNGTPPGPRIPLVDTIQRRRVSQSRISRNNPDPLVSRPLRPPREPSRSFPGYPGLPRRTPRQSQRQAYRPRANNSPIPKIVKSATLRPSAFSLRFKNSPLTNLSRAVASTSLAQNSPTSQLPRHQ
jgi:hypothetical protein